VEVVFLRKNLLFKSIILAALLTVGCILSYKYFFHEQDNQMIIYDYKHSYHHEFYSENGYVVFRTRVTLKNESSQDLHFYMYADVSEDYGLITENIATAYEKDSLVKKKFFIKAKSEAPFDIYFKAKQGEKDTKQNRLPPKDLLFEIL
jgi:hypothetical protein